MATKTKTTGKQVQRKVGRPPGSGGKAPALTAQQIRTLMKVAAAGPNGTRNVAMLSILMCGCRVSEPISVTVGDVLDPRGRVADGFVLKAQHTKSRQHRRVYLNAAAREAVQAWVDELGTDDADAPLFALNANYATNLVRVLMRDAGIKGSSHSLRRTCATMMSESGVAVRVIQETLGHSSLATTQVYLEHSPANVAKAINNAVRW